MCLAGSCRGKTTTCERPSRERGLLAACPGAPSRTPGNGPCQLHFSGTGHPWCTFWIMFKTQRPCRFLAKILLFRLGVSRQKFISNIQELLEIDIGNTIGWFLFPSQSLKKTPQFLLLNAAAEVVNSCLPTSTMSCHASWPYTDNWWVCLLNPGSHWNSKNKEFSHWEDVLSSCSTALNVGEN